MRGPSLIGHRRILLRVITYCEWLHCSGFLPTRISLTERSTRFGILHSCVPKPHMTRRFRYLTQYLATTATPPEAQKVHPMCCLPGTTGSGFAFKDPVEMYFLSRFGMNAETQMILPSSIMEVSSPLAPP